MPDIQKVCLEEKMTSFKFIYETFTSAFTKGTTFSKNKHFQLFAVELCIIFSNVHVHSFSVIICTTPANFSFLSMKFSIFAPWKNVMKMHESYGHVTSPSWPIHPWIMNKMFFSCFYGVYFLCLFLYELKTRTTWLPQNPNQKPPIEQLSRISRN